MSINLETERTNVILTAWDDWGIEATLANLRVQDDGTVTARLDLDHHMAILRALWEHRPSLVFPDLAACRALDAVLPAGASADKVLASP